MKDLRTRAHTFDSNFFIPRENPKQLMIRIQNSSMAEISSVFHEPTELAELTYRGRPYHGYINCKTIRDEGSQIFLILEA